MITKRGVKIVYDRCLFHASYRFSFSTNNCARKYDRVKYCTYYIRWIDPDTTSVSAIRYTSTNRSRKSIYGGRFCAAERTRDTFISTETNKSYAYSAFKKEKKAQVVAHRKVFFSFFFYFSTIREVNMRAHMLANVKSIALLIVVLETTARRRES